MDNRLIMLDPRPDTQPGLREPIPGLPDLKGKIIGVLDNSLPDSTPFMEALSRLLSQRYGNVLFKSKPSQSRPAPKEMLDEFAAKCHVIITGRGD